MDLSIGNKKKNDEKKPFFQDNGKLSSNNDFPKDNQHFSNDDNTDHDNPELKDGYCDTEKQIDALFLSKTNSIDEVINHQRILPKTINVEQVPQQKDEGRLQAPNNETFSILETKKASSALPKTEDDFDFSLPPTSKQNKHVQKSKKPLSLPKIRVRINKNRFDLKDSKNPEQNSIYIETYETSEFPEKIEKTIVKPKKGTSRQKKKWFSSEKDDTSHQKATITEMKPSQKKKSFSFFNKKDNKKNVTFTIESKKNDENTSFNVEHVTFEHQEPTLDEDVRKLLAITDELLGKLPEEVIAEFASSDGFVLYEKIMNKYHIK
jgi:hypothetical protein